MGVDVSILRKWLIRNYVYKELMSQTDFENVGLYNIDIMNETIWHKDNYYNGTVISFNAFPLRDQGRFTFYIPFFEYVEIRREENINNILSK
jgi:hypothetical protein